jgi:serine/threonine-protein kinase RsbW
MPDDGRRSHYRSLCVPAQPESLERVHALLHALWADHGDVSPADRMLFETAVTEIAANITQHAYDGARLDFTLRVHVHPDRVEAEFSDRGRRADIDLDNVALPDGLAESGRGLAMTLAAVDHLEYRRDGPTNYWRIARHRRPAT